MGILSWGVTMKQKVNQILWNRVRDNLLTAMTVGAVKGDGRGVAASALALLELVDSGKIEEDLSPDDALTLPIDPGISRSGYPRDREPPVDRSMSSEEDYLVNLRRNLAGNKAGVSGGGPRTLRSAHPYAPEHTEGQFSDEEPEHLVVQPRIPAFQRVVRTLTPRED